LKTITISLFVILFYQPAFCQSVTQIKKELEVAENPFAYVKDKLKKKFKVDTVSIYNTTSFIGLADSIAYKGKTGKVYGPFKGNNILIKVLAKVPNKFYHISHIIIDTAVFKKRFADSLGNTIIAKIKDGSSTFANMASTYSSDNSSIGNGGDIGWLAYGAMQPQLNKAISNHKKGDVFKVWTESGLHIIYLMENPKMDDGHALLLRVFL
jgi:parvulin-like peptidyl-prolyl isomerase